MKVRFNSENYVYRIFTITLLLVIRRAVIARLTKSAKTISAIRFEIATLGFASLAMTIINQAITEQ